ncbi:uncharacterized protein LOC110446494 [Mizuhopecten yessoensis]|uniref:Uncharacterized protein n=1 Tax=Mizuhopecten yessoensis TaxID=6573 RepID=A0A210QXC1_MIZYE|nr:uncharacterized protein LOC110446494 [Mizuhopecten yessoensis]OWF53361.1 hypothetical protein KP79_PYT09406 [Mizuhopecten yessoensis]
MTYNIVGTRLIFILILLAVTVSTAPMKCTPCAIYCSIANPAVTGPSCWSCQCEPAGDSSYKPSNAMCDYEYCKLKCGDRGFDRDVAGCPNCRCRALVRINYPS